MTKLWLCVWALLPGLCLAKEVGIHELDLSHMSAGWGKPQANQGVVGRPLRVGRKEFQLGVGTHASSRMSVALDGRAVQYSALVGVNESAGTRGSVRFRVWVDGVEKWRSPIMRGGQAALPVSVDLAGAKQLTLVVDDAGDGITFDHADWIEARVKYDGAKPMSIPDPYRLSVGVPNWPWVLVMDENRRLVQDMGAGVLADPAYPTSGNGWILEPALRVVHSTGSTGTDLRVKSMRSTELSTGQRHSVIELEDSIEPIQVDLHFLATPEHNVVEQWTEIRHRQPSAVRLTHFASSALNLEAKTYHLTQFHGDWGREATMAEEQLGIGIKVIDAKVGVRAHQFRTPGFVLSLDGALDEQKGRVIGGTLAWPGNFQFLFERQTPGEGRGDERLYVRAGMNPFGSDYLLDPGKSFVTPRMVWSFSDKGSGEMSRQLHRWARRFGMRGGDRPGPVLLNNWESTYFTFDRAKLVGLMDRAAEMGMECFLLDDGWFGATYPRDNDQQGLGDWVPIPEKMGPDVENLAKEATQRGLRFGIWIEPEMVNPRSALFEKHPDWVITHPNREPLFHRNQLILDLTRQDVQNFVFETVDRLLANSPSITFVKWDCNRFVMQPGSTGLPWDRQSHLFIEYNRALLDIWRRLAERHSHVEWMICSGGGGRVDYATLALGHEFWPSDMTDPVNRLRIQWGYSHLFPPKAMANHVTRWGNRPLDFAIDVALAGRFGFDIDLEKLSGEDLAKVRAGVEAAKSIREVVQLGDLYRLESPLTGARSALAFLRGDRAVVMVYATEAVDGRALALAGLEGEWKVRQLRGADLGISGRVVLASEGLVLPAMGALTSAVLELERVR